MRWLLIFLSTLLPATAWEIPKQCEQVIVGTAKSWSSSHVQVTLYQRDGDSWKAITPTMHGRLGSKGLAWGRGIHPTQTSHSQKREGDKKAPAGVFEIGAAYGIHSRIKKSRALDYYRVSTRDLWVEDSTSPYYNQHLRLKHEPSTEWEKKAQMRQNDYPHSLKLFIKHNAPSKTQPALAGAGSAIFFHIWRNAGASATSGCTTLPEDQLRLLISKLDPKKYPLYVLLPESSYTALQKEWKLPQR